MGTITGTGTAISSELEQELRRALKRPLPSGFAAAIADALHTNNGSQVTKQNEAQRRDAVKRLIKAGEKLQIAIKRANAAYRLSPLPRGFKRERAGREFIFDAWRVLRSTRTCRHAS